MAWDARKTFDSCVEFNAAYTRYTIVSADTTQKSDDLTKTINMSFELVSKDSRTVEIDKDTNGRKSKTIYWCEFRQIVKEEGSWITPKNPHRLFCGFQKSYFFYTMNSDTKDPA